MTLRILVCAVLISQVAGCVWSYSAGIRAPLGDPGRGEFVAQIGANN